MEASVLAAGIAAVPATLGALAAVLAAKRSGSGNREIRRMKSMLQAHLSDPTIHAMPARHLGAVRKGGRS